MTVRQVAVSGEMALPKGKVKARSPLSDAYRQLIKNQAAVIGGVFVLAITLVAVFSGLLAPHHYAEVDFASTYDKPGSRYLAGTDALGRDILSRTIYGARISLTIGVVGATVSLTSGCGSRV